MGTRGTRKLHTSVVLLPLYSTELRCELVVHYCHYSQRLWGDEHGGSQKEPVESH